MSVYYINASVVHGIMNYKGMKTYSSVEVAVLCNCEERRQEGNQSAEVIYQEHLLRSHFSSGKRYYQEFYFSPYTLYASSCNSSLHVNHFFLH